MTVFNVTNAGQLQSALARAVGGDQVFMAPGDYGRVLIHNRSYASNVSVFSTSTTDRAHLDSLTVLGSRNLSFNGLDLGRGRTAEDSEFANMNGVRNSTNIRFNDIDFHGNLDGNPQNDIVGLSVYDSSGVRITNSDFNDLGRGVYVLRSDNVQVTGNDFHDIRLDGLAVAATTGMLVHDNIFRDFKPIAGDHADAIQFWNTGQTKGSSNVSIKNNVIWLEENYPGADHGVQGIWISDPGAYDFKSFTIQNNLVYSNDRWNGISVNGGNSVQILNNTLMSRSGDEKVMWIRLEQTTGAVVANNVTEDRLIRTTGRLTQTGNIDLSDTPGMRRLFGDADNPDSLSDLILPGVGFQLTPSMRARPIFQDLIGDNRKSAALEAVAIDDLTGEPLVDDTFAIDLGMFDFDVAQDAFVPVDEPMVHMFAGYSMKDAINTDYFVALP